MRKTNVRGFTLIELMVVVAIAAILAAIAVTTYSTQIRKSRRADAMAKIQDAQLKLERWRVDHADYTGSGVTVPTSPYYSFTITAATSAPNDYVVQADPQLDQQKDSCGTLKITNTAGAISKSPSNCW